MWGCLAGRSQLQCPIPSRLSELVLHTWCSCRGDGDANPASEGQISPLALARGWGQTPGKGQAMLLLRTTSASAGYPHPGAGRAGRLRC